MLLKREDFMNLVNNPDYYVEHWTGTAIGPGNVDLYIDDDEDEISCEVDGDCVILY